MLIGEYTTKIEAKKRIAIPKKFREDLGNDLILTRGYEQALVLVNKQMWEKIASSVINGSFINKNIRDTSRFLVGSATEARPDSQGRILIPQSLFDHAELATEAVFIGLVNWIEVWDKEKWNARLDYISQNSDEIAAEIDKLNKPS